MELKLIKYPDPILTTPCQKFDFDNPPFDPIEFSHALVKLMRDSSGVGLAANQVGQPYRVFAIRGDPNRVMFNPKIIHVGEKMVKMEEGCLTFPGMICKVKRPMDLRIRYQQPNGNTTTEMYVGLTARVIQHEYDHLDGILFFNRANKYHRDKALKKWHEGERTELRYTR